MTENTLPEAAQGAPQLPGGCSQLIVCNDVTGDLLYAVLTLCLFVNHYLIGLTQAQTEKGLVDDRSAPDHALGAA